jgi:UDPglucose 6-dehydrogenase
MIVTIVGTGYVGLVTGACLASRGHDVRCVDVSEDRINLIRSGKAPFYEPGLEQLLRTCQSSRNLSVATNLSSAIDGSHISLIAVGTPTDGEHPDLSYLRTAASQIGTNLKRAAAYHVVAVKSTVVPGTTRGIVKALVEQNSGREAGEFGLCMNPEFLREGSAVEDFMNPDRVVIGEIDARSGAVMDALYSSFDCEKLHVSLEEAELTKYASNALLATLISFANELAALCEVTPGADVETVMDGLHLDHRLSPVVDGKRVRPAILSYLRAGIGFGGSCLPKDVNALRTFARRNQVPAPLLDAVMATNSRRPEQIATMAEVALGGLTGKTVALLGLAFKAGTDDLRSSPAIALLHSLAKRGANVRAHDAFVTREASASAGLECFFAESIEAALEQADAVLLTTVDTAFQTLDWDKLLARMRTPVVIDGRNVLRRVNLPETARYFPIGQGGPLLETEPQWTA